MTRPIMLLMLNQLIPIVLCAFMLAFVSGLAGCDKRAAEVIAVDEQYDRCLDSNDGEGSVKFITRDSLARYDRLLPVARTATAEQVKAMTNTDMIEVLFMRLLLGSELHKPIDGRTYFVKLVNKGWTSSTSSVQRTKVKVNSKGTTATVTYRNPEDGETFNSYWVVEDGTWKLDLLADLRNHDSDFKQIASELGMTREQVAFEYIELETGETPPSDLWNPPKP